jgi:hypothetical protein
MSALPWVVAPRQHPPRRVGTLDSGILEIPVLGGLTVDESNTIAELLAEDVSAFVLGAQLADVIAQSEEITQVEAFSIIEKAMNGAALEPKAEAIRIKYAQRLEAVTKAYTTAGQRNIRASVTAILRHRLGLTDWEMPADFPQVLLNDVWQLVVDEQTAEKLPVNRPSEDDLKKPLPVSGSASKRTGPASSGACAMPTQEPSAAAALATS